MKPKLKEKPTQVAYVPLAKLKINTGQIEGIPANPRIIKNKDFEELIRSLLVFPKMMFLRPITYAGDYVILGGNQRRAAISEIVNRGVRKMRTAIDKFPEFREKSEAEQKEIISFWESFINSELVEVPAQSCDHLSIEEQREFVIKDNVSFGAHDWEALELEWSKDIVEAWGVEFPVKKNTEILSELKYEPVYYEPKEAPKMELADCLNLEKFNAKVAALDEYELTDQQKEILKMFAYRFIKIDFENVANYYYFLATDEEKKAIERLRLVLTDNGLNGFIEDDLFRLYGFIKNEAE